ncbi:LOW QUALITY PROTEIN: rab proteins geranylgeranyltransferase component A 1, partial [Menidia menidia]
MAAEDLPSEFDVVILGTGLAESVVAAACSRVGQRVLHLDRRSHYAADWASFTFNGLLTWIHQQQEDPQPEEPRDWSGLLQEGEELLPLSNQESGSIRNLQVFCYTEEEDEEPDAPPRPPPPQKKRGTPPPHHRRRGGTPPPLPKPQKKSGWKQPESPQRQSLQVLRRSRWGRSLCLRRSLMMSHRPRSNHRRGRGRSQRTGPAPPGGGRAARLLREGRRFNIDLVSKLMFSRGSLVDLLIKSNVSRYAEFKNVSRVLTYRHGNVEQVPCSRADVFASRQLSVVEKRKLMRFLTSCLEGEEPPECSGRPYLEFLRQQQLGDNLQHFLLHSIAMVTGDTPTGAGLAATRHFLRCLGRYGNTPFLFPVYGLGEIPQCFCRMSAVFGGVYCLRHSVHSLVLEPDSRRCCAVIDSRGQRISCQHFVVEDGYLDSKEAPPPRSLSRAVLITDSSLLPSDSDQQVSVVTVPPEEAGRPTVTMVELCSSTMTCIPGTYLVHLTCQSVGSAHQDLSPLVTRMFRTEESHDPDPRPAVLWCLYFNMADGAAPPPRRLPPNVHPCSGPDAGLGHEHAVQQAQEIFQKILPHEEFCPPAPNPEDIIYDGENSAPPTGGREGGEGRRREWRGGVRKRGR